MKTKLGLSLIEVLLSTCILCLIVMVFFQVFSQSRHGTMDAYFQSMAVSLAQEPLEVFRGFGFRWLESIDFHPLAKYPINSGFTPIDDVPGDPNVHPPDSQYFERKIDVFPCEKNGIKAFRIFVTVRPKKNSRVAKLFGEQEVALQNLVVEFPG